MSTGLELIPLALAIGAVVAARKRRGAAAAPGAITLGTRMRDEELLAASLAALGDSYGEREGLRYGNIQGTPVAFSADEDGTWEAHFDREVPLDTAQRLVTDLDEVYSRLVQQQVYERLVERAGSRGLTLESEQVEEDESIVLTLLVGEEARA